MTAASDHPGPVTMDSKPVLVIGAGVVGLTLAHGLANANIPFEIYERDESPNSRTQGWAITLHWALAFLRKVLTPPVLDLVDGSQVDPVTAANDTGNFLFLNIKTLETKFRIPPNDRRRVGRQRFREALLQDDRVASKIHWGQKLQDIRVEGDLVKAVVSNGQEIEGRILVGAEGSNSKTRKFLCPDTYQNFPLDVKLLGAAVDMTPEQVKPIRDIDPLLFQGCHPETNSYLWISTLDTPATNGSHGTDNEHYKMQIILSWPVKSLEDSMVGETDSLRAEVMKRKAEGIHPLLYSAVQLVTTAQEILLQDWPCLPWDNHNGLVTITGDAAHAMTMYRGEAANHGIMDAYNLTMGLQRLYAGEASRAEVVNEYEAEMRGRTATAVLWSREACIGAHDYDGLNKDSAVLRRRAIKMPDA